MVTTKEKLKYTQEDPKETRSLRSRACALMAVLGEV